MQSLTPEQARTFLASIAAHRHYALVAVAVSLGLRQGEILGLRWDDVDLERGVVHVRRALQRFGRAGWQLVEPKSANSRRSVKLPASLGPVLRAHRTRQLESRMAAGERWQNHGFVFTGRRGQPLDGCNLNGDVKRLLADAGLPPLHFHALRHSCGTLLLVQGVAPRVVMDVLGHSDVRLTLNTYSHVVEQLQNAAAAEIESVLWTRP